MRRHRRLQHAQARALFLALDQKPCAERAHAAFASLDNERSRIAVSGFDEDFAFLQNNQALLCIEAHVHGAVGIEVEQRAVGQPHSALFAGGGTLVGEPVIERQIAFTGKQGQTHHRDNAGQTTPQFAYAAANAFARLQQRTAGRPFGDAETLIEHAQLAPGAGVFFMGRMPLDEFFALQRTAGIERQLPGYRRVQHMRRHRPGTGRTHVGSPYSAM